MNNSLSKLGYTFGLGAFRRYEQHFDTTIAHFDETFKPSRQVVEVYALQQGLTDEQKAAIPCRDISDVEINHRWAVMLKYAHDVFGGDPVTVDEMEAIIDRSPQSEWGIVREQFLDSYYLGEKMRDYFGIPASEEGRGKAKKKGFTIGEAITIAHQIGYKWDEAERLTLMQFIVALEGYRRRQDDEWDRTRHMMSAVINGYAKDGVTPMQVIGLRKDTMDELKPITSRSAAIELLKEML